MATTPEAVFHLQELTVKVNGSPYDDGSPCFLYEISNYGMPIFSGAIVGAVTFQTAISTAREAATIYLDRAFS